MEATLNELALFAGAGGGILGGKLLGWRTVCAVEFDAYAASVLVARQNDGCLAPFPIWDDVRTFDGRPWQGVIDVVSGGFPCQDISAAGAGKGIEGARSGLWREMARIIGEVRPRFVFVENSPMLASRGLGVILGDLAALGFDAEWGVLGAADIGAPHIRDRIWILAHANRDGLRIESGGASRSHRADSVLAYDHGAQKQMAHAEGARLEEEQRKSQFARPADSSEVGNSDGPRQLQPQRRQQEQRRRPCDSGCSDRAGWWAAEPDVGRMAHGVASRVDRLRAIGNGQVPGVAALAWRLLARRAGLQ